MRKLLFCLTAVCHCAACMSAAPVDEAKKLYLSGDYEAAVSRLEALRKTSPRDGNVNYYLGASLAALNRGDEAVEPLEMAETRGVTDASRLLAQLAFSRYDVDSADKHLGKWETKLSKNRNADTSPIDEMRSRVVMMRNMLQRVERVEIIDSINVAETDFFTHYRMSPEAGRLLTPAEADVYARTVVYTPQNRREMIWAETDTAGMATLMSAQILDDGTIDNAAPLQGDFSEGGDADYPFLMPDGTTLYYAATGAGSLGGYDIFLTRRSDDGYLQPQNIGMPYNSPFNDYMLAIDETSGIGWFASDRSQIPGQVTIYVFVPSQTRVNYDPDDIELSRLARITSIIDTQDQDTDYSELRDRIASIAEGGSKRSQAMQRFNIAMGNGKVYTSLDDFQNVQARRAMVDLISIDAKIKDLADKLDDSRRRYGRGDKSVSGDILDMEAQIEYMREQRVELSNKVIRLETK